MPKINRKLTETEIKNARPKQKAYKLYDEGGLVMLIRPSGTKVWQYPYKLGERRSIYTIGKYGNSEGYVCSRTARTQRDQARDLISQGINPNQIKQKQKIEKIKESSNTFEALANEWMSKQKWAAKHEKNIRSRLNKDVFKEIGNIPIQDISAKDIIYILKKIEARGAPDVAKRIGQYCSAIFDFAIIQDLCTDNPALGRSKLIKDIKRKNRLHLTETQLPTFLQKLEAFDGKKTVKLMVNLLALTFARPGELREARWEEINFSEAIWLVPENRMKKGREHIVPLSKQALAALRELHQITSNTEFLFPGASWRKPISDVGLIKAVRKLADNKATPHGFRHTASTILNEKGFNGDHIEMQLSHIDKDKVRGAYNKALYLEPRTQMMQWWADYLDGVKNDNQCS